jgi:hypothetical protein
MPACAGMTSFWPRAELISNLLTHPTVLLNRSNETACRSTSQLLTHQHQRLFVLAIIAATRTACEQLRLRRSSGIRCDRNRCGPYQNSMPDNACSKYRIASNCDRKTNCPHETQRLEHIMSYRNILNVTKRTYFSIKYEVPYVDDELSHLALPVDPTPPSYRKSIPGASYRAPPQFARPRGSISHNVMLSAVTG